MNIHLTIDLEPAAEVTLPIHYNHIVQAAIYNSIEPELSAALHNQGYLDGGRTFRLFAFSRLIGAYIMDKERNTIRFTGGMKMVVSSPLHEFCQSFANTLLTRGWMQMGHATTPVKKVSIQTYQVEEETIAVRTLSPLVLYSTLLRPDGRKYTCYFQPGDPDYNGLLSGNLRKKYRALYGSEEPAGEVRALALGQSRLHVVKYKSTVIKGYSGRMQLSGPIPLLQLGVDAGFGGKNAQGFGCVEPAGSDR